MIHHYWYVSWLPGMKHRLSLHGWTWYVPYVVCSADRYYSVASFILPAVCTSPRVNVAPKHRELINNGHLLFAFETYMVSYHLHLFLCEAQASTHMFPSSLQEIVQISSYQSFWKSSTAFIKRSIMVTLTTWQLVLQVSLLPFFSREE